ncbi:MAG TPA: STM4015 family protein [Blastocatellia bacterium]|jgi:hypothetical protein
MINEHIASFAGKPVKNWEAQLEMRDPEGPCYALRLSYEEADEGQRWTDKFAAFLDNPSSSRVSGIIIGDWGLLSSAMNETSAFVIEALVAARDRLPNLRAIFFGDVVSEECEISWIRQSDVSPLFAAYPQLEHFCVRGADGLDLGSLKHDRLKSLIIQSGGLGANVVREVAAAEMPELEHLELWLGEDGYGGDASVADLAPILEGKPFPKLKYLGLRNSQIADEIARAVAVAPVVERIRVLDLSMGILTDEGAAALLESPAVARLEKLDIHHHFCSEEMTAKLQSLSSEVDASERMEPHIYDDEVWRYVAVSE